MTNRKKFFYNGILLTVVALAIKTVNLAFNAFVSREIGAEALGLYTLIGTVYSFAITFATSGISLTVTRLVASAAGEGRRSEIPIIMKNATLYALIFSGAASLVLFFGSSYFAGSVLSEIRAVVPFRILALSLIPIALSAVFGGYFIGLKRIVRSSAVQVAAQFFKIAITVFLILKMAPLGAEYAVIALCISTTASELLSFSVALLQYIFGSREKKRGRPVSRFSDVSRMALPLAVSAYIRSALLTLEHVLIPERLKARGESATEALSSYGLLHGMALPVVLYPMSPLSSFAGLLVPEFAESLARGDYGRMNRIGAEVVSSTLRYAAPVAVFVFFFSEELGFLLYSSYEAGVYVAMLAPVIPVMYLDHVTDSMLKGIGEHVYSMWVNISDSLLSVFLIWFLIPSLGIAGYGIVIIAMEGYNFILSFLRLRRRIKFPLKLFSSFVFPTLTAVFSAFLADKIFAYSGSLTTLPWFILKLLFALSLYIFLLYSFRLISSFRKKRLAC